MDFQKGTVKKTQGQVKKHASHFTHKEVEQVYNARERVKDLWLKRGIKIGFHLQDKIRNGETKRGYAERETFMEAVEVAKRKVNGQVITRKDWEAMKK